MDRSKDVIKSGGEWISSIELENSAASHPQVVEAAVIGIAHPTWQERPLLIAVLKDDATIGKKSSWTSWAGTLPSGSYHVRG